MRLRPSGCELLATAREVVREALLPHVPPDDLAAMCAVGRTMAIATHELEFEQRARAEDLEMLGTARTVLRERLLVRLPKERQYEARLVAKAIAIAASELANGDAPEHEELVRVAKLLHELPQTAGTSREVRKQLGALSARLCAEIRAGRFDPGTARYAVLCAHLRETTRQALAESNPGYVKARTGPVDARRNAV